MSGRRTLVAVDTDDAQTRHLAELERANAELRHSEQAVRILNDQLTATVARLSAEITERLRVEELLRLAQRVSGIGSWGWDFDADRPWWSTEACRMMGISTETTASMTEVLNRLAHRLDQQRVAIALLEAEQEQRGFELELRIVRPDASERILQVRSEVFHNEEGQPLRRIGTIQDITESRRAEEERMALEGRLRQAQKMEAIGNLAGGIAHDFNNILTAVLSHAELLDLELPPALAPDTSRESVKEIVAAAHRARDLVKQILTFSRKQPATRKPILLALVVREAVKLVRPALPANVTIHTDIRVEDRAVLANESQIHQVLLNLCANAAHAMSSRPGTITVTLDHQTADGELAAMHPPLRAGPCLVLSVVDTGSGMDAETLSHLFEPFFTTKGLGQGTGLGLAVTHGIVQNHEGAVVVESKSGIGTAFHLWFPEVAVAPGAGARASRNTVPGTAAGRGRRVLFVDDEPSVSRVGVRLLEKLGYSAEAMNDPLAARERILAQPEEWDLVITDHLMPGLTGLDLAKAILRSRPDLPMILAAGFGGPVDTRRAKEVGFRDLIAKPFALQTLAKTCASALRK